MLAPGACFAGRAARPRLGTRRWETHPGRSDPGYGRGPSWDGCARSPPNSATIAPALSDHGRSQSGPRPLGRLASETSPPPFLIPPPLQSRRTLTSDSSRCFSCGLLLALVASLVQLPSVPFPLPGDAVLARSRVATARAARRAASASPLPQETRASASRHRMASTVRSPGRGASGPAREDARLMWRNRCSAPCLYFHRSWDSVIFFRFVLTVARVQHEQGEWG